MNYLLDTNIFIESKNGFYAFDICPGFWEWLKTAKKVKSISMVKDEILAGKDELSEWVKCNLSDDFFIVEDSAIQAQYNKVANYVNTLPSDFTPAKKAAFLDVADGWLIAAAMHQKATIVTHENFDLKCKRKILLPVVARQFNIQCVSIFDVLRASNIRFS